MTDQETNDKLVTNDPLKPYLQPLMQESRELFNALEKSERWRDIEPVLMTAITDIEEGAIVSAFAVGQGLDKTEATKKGFQV